MNTREIVQTLCRAGRLLLLLSVLAPALASAADLVVVVNPANHVTSLSRQQVQRLFLKQATVWPDGEGVKPVDLPKASPLRAAFATEFLGRSLATLDQFWTHSIYSGRAVPPTERRSERDVVEYVRENPGAIGYVSPGASLDGVKKVAVTD